MSKIQLELVDLTIGYGNKKVVSSVSISFEMGKFYLLVGNNGSGKSTLLKTLLGQLAPLQGSVLLNGAKHTQTTVRDRSRLIAYVPSKINYVSGISVKDVLQFGRIPHLSFFSSFSEKDTAHVHQAISFLELESFLEADFNQLSDGQQQKVRLARALIQDTPIIVLDEPTSHLDIGQKQKIFSWLHQLAQQGKMIICASHDINSAYPYVDQCILLEPLQPARVFEQNEWAVENLIQLLIKE